MKKRKSEFMIYLVVVLFFVLLVCLFMTRWSNEMEPFKKIKNTDYDSLFDEKYDVDVIMKTIKRYTTDDENEMKDRLEKIQRIQSELFSKKNEYYPYTESELFKLEDICSTNCIYTWILDDYKKRLGWKFPGLLNFIKKKYMDDISYLKNTFGNERPEYWSTKLDIPIQIIQVDSASSPSMPSGHAIIGLIFGTYLYTLNQTYFDKNVDELKLLRKKCFDIGIRRVVGGVHFVEDIVGAHIFHNMIFEGQRKLNYLEEFKKLNDDFELNIK